MQIPKFQNETLIYHSKDIIEHLWPYLLNFLDYIDLFVYKISW